MAPDQLPDATQRQNTHRASAAKILYLLQAPRPGPRSDGAFFLRLSLFLLVVFMVVTVNPANCLSRDLLGTVCVQPHQW
ncbi:hypothetical protein B0H12DRAFT_779462 [Mycena haematopus]|nr:hypothetical protein B0H12DRAFT_779462 [Mycena haematopus]